ncbi:uncharacterized protein DC041_0012438, partial [Schistosoma bovis]
QIENPRILQRAHKLSNVRNALDYLEKTCKIKLVNINPADVVDGKPAIVLGLIWSIILFYQIQGHQKVLKDALKSRRKSLSKSIDSDATGNVSSKSEETSLSEQVDSTKSFTTFHTCFLRVVFSFITQRTLEIRVTDFGSSWRDGKAFCALVHNINPSLIDMGEVMHRKNRENLEFAFNVAEQRLGVPKLLDPEGCINVSFFNFFLGIMGRKLTTSYAVRTYTLLWIPISLKIVELQMDLNSHLKIKSRSGSRRSSTNSSEKLQSQQKLKAANIDMKTESKTENEYHAALRLASFEPDPEIDPALILNASTTANFLERRRARRASLSGPQTMDDEALHNLILATSPTMQLLHYLSSTPGYTRTTMSGSPSPPSYSTSPHRSGRAVHMLDYVYVE